jgi:hypothetical protein
MSDCFGLCGEGIQRTLFNLRYKDHDAERLNSPAAGGGPVE